MSVNSYEASPMTTTNTAAATAEDLSQQIDIIQPLLATVSKPLTRNMSEASLALGQLPVMEQFLRHARNGDLAALIDLVEQSSAAVEQAVDVVGKYTKIVNTSFDFNYRGLNRETLFSIYEQKKVIRS
jgi:hypothetical protein